MLTYLLLIITKQNKNKQEGQRLQKYLLQMFGQKANSHKIQGPNKRQQRVLSSSELSETWEKETALAVERHTAQGKHTHQLHGEWSWRCKLKTPNSFLPPLPASVLAGIRHKKSNWCHLPRRALLWFTAQDKNKSEKQADSSAIWGQEREITLNCCLEQRRFDLPVTASSTPDCCPVTSQIPNWFWAFLWAASGQSDRSQYKHTLTKTDVKNKAASVLSSFAESRARQLSATEHTLWTRRSASGPPAPQEPRFSLPHTSGNGELPGCKPQQLKCLPFPQATMGMRDKVLKVRLWSFPCRNSK